MTLIKGVGKTELDPAIEGQPQTNGVAEKAVQDVTTQVRKYKIAIETRLGRPIRARSVVLKWFVEHAADTISRHTSGHDGRVPLQRLHNGLPKPIDIEFGEQVWAKLCQQAQAVPPTESGTWHLARPLAKDWSERSCSQPYQSGSSSYCAAAS